MEGQPVPQIEGEITQPKPAPRKRRTWLFVVIPLVIVLIAGGAFAWYYYFNPGCGVSKVNAGIDAMGSIIIDWISDVDIAYKTPRMGMAGPIQTLNEHKKDLINLEMPGCLIEAQSRLTESFQFSINGFLDFMGQANDNVVQAEMVSATSKMSQYTDELERIKACAPFCK